MIITWFWQIEAEKTWAASEVVKLTLISMTLNENLLTKTSSYWWNYLSLQYMKLLEAFVSLKCFSWSGFHSVPKPTYNLIGIVILFMKNFHDMCWVKCTHLISRIQQHHLLLCCSPCIKLPKHLICLFHWQLCLGSNILHIFQVYKGWTWGLWWCF